MCESYLLSVWLYQVLALFGLRCMIHRGNNFYQLVKIGESNGS